MMIFLDDPVKGLEFPSKDDRQRVENIQRDRRLWQSRHEDVYTRVSADLTADEVDAVKRHWSGLKYVSCNLLGILSRDTAEHLSLEQSTITTEDEQAQGAVDDVRRDTGWDSMLMDIVEECSALGQIGIKVRLDENVVFDVVSPDALFRGEDYFTEYSDANADPRYTIAPMAASIHARGDDRYVLLEIHEPGYVIYRAYRWTHESTKGAPTFAIKGYLGDEVDPALLIPALAASGPQRVVETGLDEPTLVVVNNEPDPLDLRFGRGDYTEDLRSLQGEFEDKLSVLLRHFHELVNGGITVLPVEAQAMMLRRTKYDRTSGGSSDFGRSGGVKGSMPTVDAGELNVIYEDAQSRDTTRYVARSAQYEGGLQSLQLIMSCFERAAGISLDRLLDASAAPESGRAMRLARMRDVKRVKRKAMRLSSHMGHVFEIALLLQGLDASVDYSFPEPFPATEDERFESVERATQRPFMTVETALSELLGWTAEQAENEAAKLQGEQHTAGMASRISGVFRQPPVTAGEVEPDDED